MKIEIKTEIINGVITPLEPAPTTFTSCEIMEDKYIYFIADEKDI